MSEIKYPYIKKICKQCEYYCTEKTNDADPNTECRYCTHFYFSNFEKKERENET